MNFSKAFDYIHQDKIDQILIKYGLPSKIVIVIMMLYESTKAIVRSLDGNTCFFEIIPAFLQGDTFVPYLLIIYRDYEHQPSIGLIKNVFNLKGCKNLHSPALCIDWKP